MPPAGKNGIDERDAEIEDLVHSVWLSREPERMPVTREEAIRFVREPLSRPYDGKKTNFLLAVAKHDITPEGKARRVRWLTGLLPLLLPDDFLPAGKGSVVKLSCFLDDEDVVVAIVTAALETERFTDVKRREVLVLCPQMNFCRVASLLIPTFTPEGLMVDAVNVEMVHSPLFLALTFNRIGILADMLHHIPKELLRQPINFVDLAISQLTTTSDTVHLLLDTMPEAVTAAWDPSADLPLFHLTLQLSDCWERMVAMTPVTDMMTARQRGSTILHAAVARRTAADVAVLLARLPAEARALLDGDGQTPLDIANKRLKIAIGWKVAPEQLEGSRAIVARLTQGTFTKAAIS